MALADPTQEDVPPTIWKHGLSAPDAEENDQVGERPQLILQPRGTRDGGPQHFAKSMRQGVRISDLQNAIGSEADALVGLYPDGVARLWGSTPTSQANNEKVRALRGRRVGDDVLFYTGNCFIARATVVRLFTSPVVAEAVWGRDENGSTWSHVMALDDFEEFPQPLPALDILAELEVPRPLRMLTLRSANDYARIAHRLPATRRPTSPDGSGRPQAAATPRMTRPELLTRLETLRTHRGSAGGEPSRHQPLALLWALARVAAGGPRLAPWSDFRSGVGPLLSEYGLPGSKVTPEYPFWHLRGSGLWEVHGVGADADSMPSLGTLNATQPEAGLREDAARLLQDPATRLEALLLLRSRYLHDVDPQALLDRLGLTGYTTAEGIDEDPDDASEDEPMPTGAAPAPERAAGATRRRDVQSSRPVRNSAIVNRVKEIHGSRCQVCRTRLRYNRKPYSEAAHIRGLGKPHHGPDELHNLLCLCANHHVLFDGLEIYIDTEGVVRETHGDQVVGPLQQHPDHPVDETYVEYHRTLCMLNRLPASG
ncbi:HNH endonuclease [Streptomyces sp. NRRL WC-3742]|uniref:HNH endonuclease n=1 Tax=Streptomyces sp. NRRL WC-3742 TaxID=1463934 RepID=UPI000AF8BC88|nr:HNH endonuclease [Streptomyces sp. NRRL WC-3742]